jgi:hypothetical protein
MKLLKQIGKMKGEETLFHPSLAVDVWPGSTSAETTTDLDQSMRGAVKLFKSAIPPSLIDCVEKKRRYHSIMTIPATTVLATGEREEAGLREDLAPCSRIKGGGLDERDREEEAGGQEGDKDREAHVCGVEGCIKDCE